MHSSYILKGHKFVQIHDCAVMMNWAELYTPNNLKLYVVDEISLDLRYMHVTFMYFVPVWSDVPVL